MDYFLHIFLFPSDYLAQVQSEFSINMKDKTLDLETIDSLVH